MTSVELTREWEGSGGGQLALDELLLDLRVGLLHLLEEGQGGAQVDDPLPVEVEPREVVQHAPAHALITGLHTPEKSY